MTDVVVADDDASGDADRPPGKVRRALRFMFWRHLCFGGLIGALIFFIVSVSPSLLPRGALFQGILSGISVTIGYGLGSAVSAIARKFDPPEPSPDIKRWCWWGLLGVGVVAMFISLWYGNLWNEQTRTLMGMTDLEPWDWGLTLIAMMIVAGIIMVVSRGIRGLTRLAIRRLDRHVPRRWSVAIGVTLVVLLTIGIIDGVILRAAHEAMNSTYSLLDRDTTPGIVQPTSSLRSGSDESLVEWSDMGTKGRDFAGAGGGEEKQAGPDAADIEAFNGAAAFEPIRVYVGLRNADSLDDRVELALAELDRTNAWDREILAVYGTTGTGWIDERVADSLEYIWGGDTAAVGLQYSYLPSWVSFLVDQQKAKDSGAALIDAVVDRVAELPEDDRPRVLLFGESLGSLATEAAFDSLDQMVEQTDGAMLVGPTFANDLREEFTNDRDDGSPAWRPVYEEGQRVRFAVEPADLSQPEKPWDDPHIVYLQNSSDPISFFSFDLLWSAPEWLDSPRAPDANPKMSWFPIVTFWQVTADLTYSFGAPAGHGHRYGANVVDGWVAIAAPDTWTDDDTQRLRDVVGHE